MAGTPRQVVYWNFSTFVVVPRVHIHTCYDPGLQLHFACTPLAQFCTTSQGKMLPRKQSPNLLYCAPSAVSLAVLPRYRYDYGRGRSLPIAGRTLGLPPSVMYTSQHVSSSV
ncbi:hypothetical protein IG631_21481 [Alternaria alternata]|nr:hypothetical protein IG631_21481 [Alternaria alternata]